jgi:hypothetical protein
MKMIRVVVLRGAASSSNPMSSWMRMIRAVVLRRRPGFLEQPDIVLVLVMVSRQLGVSSILRSWIGKSMRRRESIEDQQSLSIGDTMIC